MILLGGVANEVGEQQLPVWLYPLGKTCGESGCGHDQQCDGTRGVCVCASDGGAPPCIRAPPPPPGLVLRDGSVKMIGEAWFLVLMSIVGANLGGWVMRRTSVGKKAMAKRLDPEDDVYVYKGNWHQTSSQSTGRRPGAHAAQRPPRHPMGASPSS